jgi:3-phenylpropionate/trans-cinnamate dioxygenase ferredoxin reductase subunit
MGNHIDILVAGAGQAGAQLAISLRQGGFTGSICLVGDEPELPYERPPLSKEYLVGDRTAEKLALRPEAFWSQRSIELRLGETIVAVDAAGHEVQLASGGTLRYGQLVWATGGRPRALPFAAPAQPGVFAVRTRADVDRLRAALDGVERVAIVGAGYIGLEAAPALLKLGKQVSVLESQERVLARVTCPAVSEFYAREHRAHGVDLRTGVRLEGLLVTDAGVEAIRFADGQADLPCQAVIAAIGILPATGVLQAAGAECSNGVEVDSFCQTSLPDVFAIGDCANHVNRYAAGQRVRVESVPNAVEQAKVVAQVVLGKPVPYAAVPWFWSNQYDIRLQTVGLNIGHDDVILRGDPATRSFSAIYLREERVVAIDCINAPRDFVQGKALVERALRLAPQDLADESRPLKALADAAP